MLMISSDQVDMQLLTTDVLVVTVHYLQRIVPHGPDDGDILFRLIKRYESEIERRSRVTGV
jgi:hypothetical protein